MNINSRRIKEQALYELNEKLKNEEFVIVRGNKTIELLNKTLTFDANSSCIINIDGIFKTSEEYIKHETKWYESQNPNNEYIKQYAQIWSSCSDKNGMTNSNYGYLLFSPQNGYQFDNVVKALKEDVYSRRAIAYYTNPFMHFTGGNDHVCTVYVSYMVRNGKLNAFVSMRSNDLRFGLIGADLEWQKYILTKLGKELNLPLGEIYWHAVSLHLYERHFEQLKQIIEK